MALLIDGFKTIITALSLPTPNQLKERELQPPGLDAGGTIDNTTMRNTRFRTFSGKALITLTVCKIMCEYDPIIYQTMIAQLGRAGNQLFAVQFPDMTFVRFWAFPDKLTPPSHKEGDMPLLDVELQPTNQNTGGQEVPPVYSTS